MNKKIIMSAICALAMSPVFAQTPDVEETVEYSTDKYKVETNRFWDNWFISAGAGAQVFFGDHDQRASFGDRISPALDVNIGKWFTPGIGVRFGYNGLSYKGATKIAGDPTSVHGTGDLIDGGGAPHFLQKQKFNYYNFHLDVMLNLTNLICGYRDGRFYNIIPYGGVGITKVTEDPKNVVLGGQFGILNTFRLSSAVDLNLDIRGTLGGDAIDGEMGGRCCEGALSATIGFTYKFKKRGWDKPSSVTRTVYNNDEVNALRERIRQLTEELEAARAKGDQKTVETVVKQIASSNLVIFKIGKSDLSNEARANLGMFAEVVKRGDKSTVYTITGYADAGTGSAALNERLSKARAEAVYDCLVNEFGVDESQLQIDYKGGVENMFYDDPRLSRAVITRAN